MNFNSDESINQQIRDMNDLYEKTGRINDIYYTDPQLRTAQKNLENRQQTASQSRGFNSFSPRLSQNQNLNQTQKQQINDLYDDYQRIGGIRDLYYDDPVVSNVQRRLQNQFGSSQLRNKSNINILQKISEIDSSIGGQSYL